MLPDGSDYLHEARGLGRFHGSAGLPWMAPECWPESMQNAYTRGFEDGITGATPPLVEAELALMSAGRDRLIDLIASGITWERDHRAPIRATFGKESAVE